MAILRAKKSKEELVDLKTQNELRDLVAFAKQNELYRFPMPVRELARKLGIRVRKVGLDDNISGHLRSKNGRWVITVNGFHHPNRQRFTIAHELGHFILHRDVSDEFTDRIMFRENGRQNYVESEANKFAAELLMPEEEFSALIKSGTKKVDDIAKKFGVSALAARFRAKTLGFKGHGL